MVVCGLRAVLRGSRRSWEGAEAAGPWGGDWSCRAVTAKASADSLRGRGRGSLQSCPDFGQAGLAWTGPWTWGAPEGGACPGAGQLPSAQGHSRRVPSGH